MVVIHKPSTTRITSQQQAVYQAVKTGQRHFKADEVCQLVRKTLPRVSLATVYRNLESLTDRGLIAKATIGGVAYFETDLQPHYHAVCLSCGAIDNLQISPATDIEEFFSRDTKYKLTGHELVLYGLCPRCQKKR